VTLPELPGDEWVCLPQLGREYPEALKFCGSRGGAGHGCANGLRYSPAAPREAELTWQWLLAILKHSCVFLVAPKTARSFPLLSWTGERKYDERLTGENEDRERSLSDYRHGQNRFNLGRKGS